MIEPACLKHMFENTYDEYMLGISFDTLFKHRLRHCSQTLLHASSRLLLLASIPPGRSPKVSQGMSSHINMCIYIYIYIYIYKDAHICINAYIYIYIYIYTYTHVYIYFLCMKALATPARRLAASRW